jgi:hypothetical protein
MKILRTLVTNGLGDSDTDQLENWDPGMAAEGVWLEGELPVTVGTPGTPTVADLRNILAGFLGAFTLRYRLGQQYTPYEAIPGDTLRNVHRAMTLREVYNDFVGAAQTAGAKTFRVRLFLTPNRMNAKGAQRFIGWTQGRTMEVIIAESGSAFTAGALNLTRTAAVNATWRLIPAYRVGPDQFTHLPHYREVNRAATDVAGPDGKHLVVWDDNAAFAASVIGKYSVRIGEHQVIDQVEPRYIDEDYAREVASIGGADISDEVTILYAADPYEAEEKLLTGAPYVKLVSQDVASILARFLYFPSITDVEALAITAGAVREAGEDMSAQLPEPPADPRHNGHQAVAPLEFVRRDDARFHVWPGLMASKESGSVIPFVPRAAVAAAGALKAAAGDASAEAMARKAQKLTLLRMPGVTASSGRGRGNIRNAARAAFGGLF